MPYSNIEVPFTFDYFLVLNLQKFGWKKFIFQNGLLWFCFNMNLYEMSTCKLIWKISQSWLKRKSNALDLLFQVSLEIGEVKRKLTLTEDDVVTMFRHRRHSDYFFDVQVKNDVLSEVTRVCIKPIHKLSEKHFVV